MSIREIGLEAPSWLALRNWVHRYTRRAAFDLHLQRGRKEKVLVRPKFSVLLVVNNALPIVVGALDSLKQQTFGDYEIIVVDGASSDGTMAVLEGWAKQLPLRIVSEPDGRRASI